jgi:hypothetical protein
MTQTKHWLSSGVCKATAFAASIRRDTVITPADTSWILIKYVGLIDLVLYFHITSRTTVELDLNEGMPYQSPMGS